ncbi:MAG: NAD(P)H-binding protein, partial [Acidobacteriota bacterium]|nr:NAD(P)H-binding protein [Acidobacteriota bacterium]
GYPTRSLVRDASRLPETSPRAQEVFAADARRPEALRGACDGAGVVISSMGASLKLGRTRDPRATYRDVDYLANLNLLAEARRAGVRKFIYVSLYGAEGLRGLAYVDAHEEFVAALKTSGLDYTVVRPTGFFYVFEEVYRMARRGRVALVGSGAARTNPVHEEDVAEECVDAVECGDREVSVGGPETYTRREIAEMAFNVLGRRPKIVSLPPPVMRAALQPLRLFDQRLYDFLDFAVAASTRDLVAPPAGRTSLRRHFRHLAGITSGINPALRASAEELKMKN